MNSVADIRDIRRLDVADRLQLVEDIWDTIADDPDSLPLTPAQIAELDRRLDDFERHPDGGESWPALRERLRRER